MNLFQILALFVVGVFFVATWAAALRGSLARRDGFLWVTVWVGAAIAIIWPGVTRVVARALGIGRGADLVFYCAVVVMLIGFLMTYARLRRLRQDLTTVVRHLAIRDAVVNSSLVMDNPASSAETSPSKSAD